MEFVVSLNLNRRHLTTGQKAKIGLDMLPMLEREAKERQRAGGASHSGNQHTGIKKMEVPTELKEVPRNHHNGEAAAQAAKLVGTSTTRIYEMKRIQKEAPEKEACAFGESDGTLSVSENGVTYEVDSVLSAGGEGDSSVAEPSKRLVRDVDASGAVQLALFTPDGKPTVKQQRGILRYAKAERVATEPLAPILFT